jgi:hypothetical protein
MKKSSDDDMATMPIPELINAIRTKTKAMPPAQMVTALLLNVLCNRMNEQLEVIAGLEEDKKTLMNDLAIVNMNLGK